jgi:antitoxin (DNA-binding transcriptional repressor) of toxin-antitoxin stability system
MREFRAGLAGYIESGEPVHVTRHGLEVGVFVPSQPRPALDRAAAWEAYRQSAGAVRQDLEERGIDPEDLIRDVTELRRQSR